MPASFAMQYVADFAFSYVDGRGEYFNGHWCDVVYLAVMAVLAIALCMLDPKAGGGTKNSKKVAENETQATIPVMPQPTSLSVVNGGLF